MNSFTVKNPENCGTLNMSGLMHQLISKKILFAIDFASKASIYNPKVTAIELSTAQSIILSLMHSFLTSDLNFTLSLLELATNIEHLKSSYLPIWLKDDFNFSDTQVIMIISRVAVLIESGIVFIPPHILKVFLGLIPKYKVVEHCKVSQNHDLLRFMTEFAPVTSNIDSFLSSSTTNNISYSSNINHDNSVINNKNEASSVTTSDQEKDLSENVQEAQRETDEEAASNTEEQEVWIENSKESAVVDQATAVFSVVNKLREFLKVPEDFEEAELFNLIKYTDKEDSTPLHNAVREGDPLIVECMLKAGAKVNATDAFGYTPTLCAASIGSVAILQVLSQHEADLSLARSDGCTPLHESVINGHVCAGKWLVNHGANINKMNDEGWSPLHLAAQWDQLEMAKFLVEKGASQEVYNHNGQTPLDIARQEGHMSVVELLTSNPRK